jgi:hypothetical protein
VYIHVELGTKVNLSKNKSERFAIAKSASIKVCWQP